MKKILPFGGVIVALMLLVTFFVASVNAATTWNTTGNYFVKMNYQGTDYITNLPLVKDGVDGLWNLTPDGGSLAVSNTYTRVLNSSTVDDDSLGKDASNVSSSHSTSVGSGLVLGVTTAPTDVSAGSFSSDGLAFVPRSSMLALRNEPQVRDIYLAEADTNMNENLGMVLGVSTISDNALISDGGFWTITWFLVVLLLSLILAGITYRYYKRNINETYKSNLSNSLY